MTFSQALQKIHKHWKVLPHESKASHEPGHTPWCLGVQTPSQ